MKFRKRALLAIMILFLLAAVCSSQMSPMPAEQTATVFGQSIHYYEAGQGPTVILLHGLGANAGIWAANIGPLSAHYHVIAPDQIGFGHSDKPLIDYKIATFVDFLYGFMQTQKIAKATLVGNSLGGWIAVDFAIQHPEMVEKLVLVDAGGLSFDSAPPTINEKLRVGILLAGAVESMKFRCFRLRRFCKPSIKTNMKSCLSASPRTAAG
jgi:pimeloyl-ACP methyl ester carboxylesterase